MSNKLSAHWLLLTLLVITSIIYWPGLAGGFFFDDTWNIESNSNIKITSISLESLTQVILSGESGPLKRPISMISFSLNHYFSGMSPFYFKLTNLFIHLINGLAIFFLTQLLLSTYKRTNQPSLSDKSITWLSLTITAAWLLHPLNLTSVLYIVQRMNSLASFFVLSGLIMYVWGRQRLLAGQSGIAILIFSIIIFLPLAVLSKENGALLPVLMLTIELSLFKFVTHTPAKRTFLISFFITTVLIPTLAILGYLIQHPEILTNNYYIRDFDLQERLLTETRILWMYLQMIVFPIGGNYGLFHDDIEISRSLFQPITTLFSTFSITALIIAAFWSIKRAPLISFGILFFIAGHSMESTVIGLELAHEHRNYLPQLGILIPLFYYIFYPPARLQGLPFRQVVPAILIILFATTTLIRASDWGDVVDFSVAEIKHHPNSPRANYQMGRIYATLAEKTKHTSKHDQHFKLAASHFIKSAQLRDNYTDGLFALLVLHSSDGKAIDEKHYETLVHRLKTEPFTSNSINQIASLVRCRKLNVCQISNTHIEQILYAALSNTTLVGKHRAIALSASSGYFSSLANNHAIAIALLQQAIQISPNNPKYHIRLANQYFKTNQLELATKHLESARMHDRWKQYEKQINSFKTRIIESPQD